MVIQCVPSAHWMANTGLLDIRAGTLLCTHSSPQKTCFIFPVISNQSCVRFYNSQVKHTSRHHAQDLELVIIFLTIRGRRTTFCLNGLHFIWIYLGWADLQGARDSLGLYVILNGSCFHSQNYPGLDQNYMITLDIVILWNYSLPRNFKNISLSGN